MNILTQIETLFSSLPILSMSNPAVRAGKERLAEMLGSEVIDIEVRGEVTPQGLFMMGKNISFNPDEASNIACHLWSYDEAKDKTNPSY